MDLSDERRNTVVMFIIGGLIRSIPHLVTAHPIGFDTIFYAAQVRDGGRTIGDPNLIFDTPLFFVATYTLTTLTNLEPLTLLRIVQPLLYGFLATAFYYMARHLLGWNPKRALLAAGMFALQTATLRISWDLLRNELSLALLLYTLPTLKNIKKKPITFVLLSTLVALSHQMTTVILFVIVGGWIAIAYRERTWERVKTIGVASIPFALLLVGMFLNEGNVLIFPVPEQASVSPTVLDIPLQNTLPSPFVNYLAGEGVVDYNQSYLYLLTDVYFLAVASFGLLLPLTLLGFFRERTLDLWTGFCVFASLNCLITPFAALLFWDRWMQLLIVPHTIYAINGLRVAKRRWPRLPLAKLAAIISTIIAVLYLTSPATNPVSPYALLWSASKYSPPTMLSHTAPVDDTPSIIQALTWIDETMEADACLLTRRVFLFWAELHLSADKTIVNYRNEDVAKGLSYAQTSNFTQIYWIWWRNGVGQHWYGQAVPTYFDPIYTAGEIVIYAYTG